MPAPPAPAHSPQHRRHGECRGSGDRGHACPAPRGEVMGSGSAVDRFHACSPAVCVEGLWIGPTRVRFCAGVMGVGAVCVAVWLGGRWGQRRACPC